MYLISVIISLSHWQHKVTGRCKIVLLPSEQYFVSYKELLFLNTSVMIKVNAPVIVACYMYVIYILDPWVF